MNGQTNTPMVSAPESAIFLRVMLKISQQQYRIAFIERDAAALMVIGTVIGRLQYRFYGDECLGEIMK